MRYLKNLLTAVLLGTSLLLMACDRPPPPSSDGRLLIVVPDISQGIEAEFERELALLFGVHLHTAVDLIPSPSNQIDEVLRKSHAQLAAASQRSSTSDSALRFGPSYQTVREQIICNRESAYPKKIADLADKKLAVLSGSAQEETLVEVHQQFPALRWQTSNAQSMQKLLQEVAEGSVDCAVANELQLADALNYYSNLVAAFDIGSPSRLAWTFPADADPELLKEAQAFFALIRQDGTLNRLLDRYYGHAGRLLDRRASCRERVSSPV